MKKRVFISYSYEDKKFVEWLQDNLQDLGLEIWYDQQEIHLGDSIKKKIALGIESSSAFIVILSKSSKNSNWVRYELNSAFGCGTGGASPWGEKAVNAPQSLRRRREEPRGPPPGISRAIGFQAPGDRPPISPPRQREDRTGFGLCAGIMVRLRCSTGGTEGAGPGGGRAAV